MKFEIYRSISNGEEVYNIYDSDSKRFIVSCHKKQTAIQIAELLTMDNKEEEL